MHVTDNGYHGEVVVTCIDYDTFRGYYLADGIVVSGLRLEDFKKIVAHVDLKMCSLGKSKKIEKHLLM